MPPAVFKLPLFGLVTFVAGIPSSPAQTSIRGIATDFGGFFVSYEDGLETGLNPGTNRPNNAHDLLAFHVGGNFYSTGVNDALLTTNSIIFTAGNFGAFLPFTSEANNAGQGSAEDGDPLTFAGQVYPTPPGTVAPDVRAYLTDGVRGLGMSTFANNVGGTFTFDLTNVDGSTVGDGIPDLFYFNMAAPSGGTVSFEFFDGANNSLGIAGSPENAHPNIARVQNDRFDTNTGTNNGGSQTASNQNVQGFAIELSDIPGMTQLLLETAVRLDVVLPSTADPPFIGYNWDAFTANAVPTPEPSGVLLLVLAAGALGCARRRG